MVGAEVRGMVTALARVMVVLAFCTSSVFAGSSDCKGRRLRKVERLVCSDQVLSTLHEEMLYAYAEALVVAPEKKVIKTAQREWLKRRDACADSDCIKRAYEERIVILQTVASSSGMNARGISGVWWGFKSGPDGPIELNITSGGLDYSLCKNHFILSSKLENIYTFSAEQKSRCYPASYKYDLKTIKISKDKNGDIQVKYYSGPEEKDCLGYDYYFMLDQE